MTSLGKFSPGSIRLLSSIRVFFSPKEFSLTFIKRIRIVSSIRFIISGRLPPRAPDPAAHTLEGEIPFYRRKTDGEIMGIRSSEATRRAKVVVPFPPRPLRYVRRLVISSRPLSHGAFSTLMSFFPEVEPLWVYAGDNLRNDSFDPLKHRLTHFRLEANHNRQVGDKLFERPIFASLRLLSLMSCTGVTKDCLGSLPDLKKLYLSGGYTRSTSFTWDESLMRNLFPKLTKLVLYRSFFVIFRRCIEGLFGKFRRLEVLELQYVNSLVKDYFVDFPTTLRRLTVVQCLSFWNRAELEKWIGRELFATIPEVRFRPYEPEDLGDL